MATTANYTAQKVEVKEALENLFNVMRKYKDGTTTEERKVITETVINSMPNEWELHQRLSNAFNY